MESNDKKFDTLIGQAIANQKQREQMNARIMEAVRRTSRRRKRLMWFRMVAFALFVPVSAFAFAGCILLAKDYLAETLDTLAIVPIAIVAIVGVITEIKLVEIFSLHKV